MSTGHYEWSNEGIEAEWAKCLTPIGEPFDDGRYRQASYEATKGDCVDSLTRNKYVHVEPPVDPATTGTDPANTGTETTVDPANTGTETPSGPEGPSGPQGPSGPEPTGTETPVEPVTQTITITVWPDRVPELDETKKVFLLDGSPFPEMTVEAASTFYVKLEERIYFPNGFAWIEPTPE